MWVLLGRPRFGGAQVMPAITTIGLDIANSVFHVHGVLVTRAAGAWSQGSADAAGLCEALLQPAPTVRKKTHHEQATDLQDGRICRHRRARRCAGYINVADDRKPRLH